MRLKDYSQFQFFVLKNILKSDSMIILGDISQKSIHTEKLMIVKKLITEYLMEKLIF